MRQPGAHATVIKNTEEYQSRPHNILLLLHFLLVAFLPHGILLGSSRLREFCCPFLHGLLPLSVVLGLIY